MPPRWLAAGMALCFAAAPAPPGGPVADATPSGFREIAPGCARWDFTGPWRKVMQDVTVVRADLDIPGVSAEVECRRETTIEGYHRDRTERAAKEDIRLVATLNGSVLGAVAAGRVVSCPKEEGPEICWGMDGRGAFIRPIDFFRSAIGKEASEGIRGALCPWPPGCPPVVEDGTGVDEAVLDEGVRVARVRNPRSLAGIGAKGRRVYLVLIRGRSQQSVGMTLDEAGAFLCEQLPEIESAVNLDGGASSSLFVAGEDIRRMACVRNLRKIPSVIHILAPGGEKK
ncbi:MAG: phosphodiester glycosidase family protein [Planctomycetota bacterium]